MIPSAVVESLRSGEIDRFGASLMREVSGRCHDGQPVDRGEVAVDSTEVTPENAVCGNAKVRRFTEHGSSGRNDGIDAFQSATNGTGSRRTIGCACHRRRDTRSVAVPRREDDPRTLGSEKAKKLDRELTGLRAVVVTLFGGRPNEYTSGDDAPPSHA